MAGSGQILVIIGTVLWVVGFMIRLAVLGRD
jgi:cell division protein FtsX